MIIKSDLRNADTPFDAGNCPSLLHFDSRATVDLADKGTAR